MKKLITICLSLVSILLLGSIIKVESIFALSCGVELHSPKSNYTKEEEFSVTVNISNLQSENGIVALGAILDYDKTALDLKEVIGENEWVAQIGKNKSKIVAYSGKKVIKDENVMKLTFVIKKDTTANNTWIKVSNFEISDGNEEITVSPATLNISVQDKKEPPQIDYGNNENSGSTTTTVPNTPDNNENQNNTEEEPNITEKPIEEEPNTDKEEIKKPTQPIKTEANTNQNNTSKWFWPILFGLGVIIILTILGYIINKKK